MVAQICQSQLGINRKKHLGGGKKEKWLRWEMANKSNGLVVNDLGGGRSGLLSIALRLASEAGSSTSRRVAFRTRVTVGEERKHSLQTQPFAG